MSSSGIVTDYYTIAKIAVRKVNVYPSDREYAIQYIVMKLWEGNIDSFNHTFPKMVTIACNKAKDFIRLQTGRTGNRTVADKEHVNEFIANYMNPNPEKAIHQKLDYGKLPSTTKNIIEDYIVNGKSLKEIGKAQGVSESRISQVLADEVMKAKRRLR